MGLSTISRAREVNERGTRDASRAKERRPKGKGRRLNCFGKHAEAGCVVRSGRRPRFEERGYAILSVFVYTGIHYFFNDLVTY